jgi:pimeloyl-ACP methyl ester carboxylesterase
MRYRHVSPRRLALGALVWSVPCLAQAIRPLPLRIDPRRVIVTGSSAGGLAAAYVALMRPDLFGNVLSRSGAFWRGAELPRGESALSPGSGNAGIRGRVRRDPPGPARPVLLDAAPAGRHPHAGGDME